MSSGQREPRKTEPRSFDEFKRATSSVTYHHGNDAETYRNMVFWNRMLMTNFTGSNPHGEYGDTMEFGHHEEKSDNDTSSC